MKVSRTKGTRRKRENEKGIGMGPAWLGGSWKDEKLLNPGKAPYQGGDHPSWDRGVTSEYWKRTRQSV